MSLCEGTSLDELWDEIGLSQEERDESVSAMKKELASVRASFTSETRERVDALTKEIDRLESAYSALLLSVGANAPTGEVVGSLREREQHLKTAISDFRARVLDRRLSEFAALQNRINAAFNRLAIDDKGAFAEVGNEDLTSQRLASYEKKAAELEAEVARRGAAIEEIEREAEVLARDMQEECPEPETSLSDSAIERAAARRDALKDLYARRKRSVAEMAVEITRLWDLLRVGESERRAFVEQHTALSEKNVRDCVEEAERLTELRNESIDEITERLRAEIERYSNDLGYSEDQRREIQGRCDGQEKIDRFEKCEAERTHLRRIMVAAQPMIDLIKQRKEIVEEFGGLSQLNKLQAEKVARRHRYVLPRVEKKVKILLLRFRDDDGSDFMWEGKPVIAELDAVQVAPSELQQVKRKRNTMRTSRRLLAEAPDPIRRRSVMPNADPVMNKTYARSRKSTEPQRMNRTAGL